MSSVPRIHAASIIPAAHATKALCNLAMVSGFTCVEVSWISCLLVLHFLVQPSSIPLSYSNMSLKIEMKSKIQISICPCLSLFTMNASAWCRCLSLATNMFPLRQLWVNNYFGLDMWQNPLLHTNNIHDVIHGAKYTYFSENRSASGELRGKGKLSPMLITIPFITLKSFISCSIAAMTVSTSIRAWFPDWRSFINSWCSFKELTISVVLLATAFFHKAFIIESLECCQNMNYQIHLNKIVCVYSVSLRRLE